MYNYIGTFRQIPPEETLARLQSLLFNPFGITRLADLTGLDNLDIPTFAAIRPCSKSLSVALGKGVNKTLAKVSALMEAVEFWHAEHLPASEIKGSFNQLVHHLPVILDPSIIGIDDTSQLDGLVLDWVEVQNLANQKQFFMPRHLFNLDKTQCHTKKAMFQSSTNGLAAGNTLEEALCHGFFEIIERDCYSRFCLLEDKACRLVNLSHLPSQICYKMISHIMAQHMEILIYDITTDLGIPAYFCTIKDTKHVRNLGHYAGFGCHFNDEVAMLRAITEAAQSRLAYISGARDDIESVFHQQFPQTKTNPHAGRHKPNYQESMPESINLCLQQLTEHLLAHGYDELYYFNHTRPNYQIPVIHAVIPGMLANIKDFQPRPLEC